MKQVVRVCCVVAGIVFLGAQSADAAEVCGDGLDNDSDSMTDEGCWPTGVTGVCEQPLSCARHGNVSPATGQLVYRFPPDLSPKVAFGPGLYFQRTYTSLYDPGYGLPSSTDYRAPMGYRFQLLRCAPNGTGSRVPLHVPWHG